MKISIYIFGFFIIPIIVFFQYETYSYEQSTVDSAIADYDKFKKSRAYNNETYKIYEILSQFYRTSDPAKSFEITNEGLKLAIENETELGQQILYNKLGNLFFDKGLFSKALENYQLSYEKAIKQNRLGAASFCLNDIGYIYFNMRKPIIALDFYKKAIDLALEYLKIDKNDFFPLTHSYSNAAHIYKELNLLDSQYIMLEKGLKINYQHENLEEINNSLFEIGKYYLGIDLDSALFYFNQNIDYYTLNTNKLDGFGKTFFQIARAYRSSNNKDSTHLYYKKAIIEFENIEYFKNLAIVYEEYATYLISLGLYKDAKLSLEKAEDICIKYNFTSTLVYIYKVKSQLAIKLDNYEQAYNYQKYINELTDSLNSKEIDSKTLLMIAELQSFKNKRELDLIKQRNINFTSFLIIIILLIILIVIVLWSAYKSKKSHNLHLVKNNKALELLNNQLEQANIDKDKFFTILAHDMRTPVHGIHNSLSMIYSNWDLFTHEELRAFISDYTTSAEGIADLLEELLNWSNAQSGELPFFPQAQNLNEVITSKINLLKSNINLKNIEVKNNVDIDIIVDADYVMLNAIIRNLLSNSIKFTPKDGTIIFSAQIQKNNILISIQDTGVGISENAINSILDKNKYYTSIGTNNESGTGLGFNLMLTFVEMHGGNMKINSKIGKGTEITFEMLKFNNH